MKSERLSPVKHTLITFSNIYSELLDLLDHCSGLGIQLVPVLEVAPQVQFDDLDDLYSTIEDFMTCFTNSQ